MSINKHSLEKTGFVDVDGGAIHYRYYIPHDAEARTRTPLVYVHGGPGSPHLFAFDALNKLADHRPVLFYDQLGSYFSPAEMTPELMTVERFSKEPEYLLNKLDIEKAIFMGHSWGPTVMIEFTLKHPEQVAGLIFSSPLISTKRWISDCNILLRELPQNVQDTITHCEKEQKTDNDQYKKAAKEFYKKHSIRQKAPLSIVHLEKYNDDIYKYMWGPSEFSCTGILKDLDLSPRLKELEMPTLFITGEYDTARPDTMKEFAATMKDAVVKVVPNSGHVTYFDNNEFYLKTVKSFLTNKIDN